MPGLRFDIRDDYFKLYEKTNDNTKLNHTLIYLWNFQIALNSSNYLCKYDWYRLCGQVRVKLKRQL